MNFPCLMHTLSLHNVSADVTNIEHQYYPASSRRKVRNCMNKPLEDFLHHPHKVVSAASTAILKGPYFYGVRRHEGLIRRFLLKLLKSEYWVKKYLKLQIFHTRFQSFNMICT
uniref:Uncharacterized protein n=1 Tax=Glossina palpalis gambiensis TaxID=67801 RepID=A0A1B0B275_9MUSC